MPFLDLSLPALREYRPEVAEPADFDDFWSSTLAGARSLHTAPTLTLVDAGLSSFEVYDVEFAGFGGHGIRGWFIVPANTEGPLPTIVQYHGYGGGRGLPHERLAWPAAGYAYFTMDTRGQGSNWGSGGETPDPVGSGPATPGFMTQGIDDPEDYYYRRLYTDAARAIDAVRTFDRVDASRVTVVGGSQGGGLAIAAAGLVPDVFAVMPDVPFLSHFERAVGLTDAFPYAEIVKYLSIHRGKEAGVYETLSYFDGVNFAKRALAPALYSVALMDETCPPSTVFASFNLYGGPADIEIYPFNNHEGGGEHQWVRQAAWLKALPA
jgi:cephalosporin-C deacetylase